MLIVSEMFIYPVKSLGGIAVSSAILTERGLQHDRRWMLTDAQNNFITQREMPAMALLQTSINDDGLHITHKQNGESLLVPFQLQTTDTLMVDVWSDRCRAQAVSEEANAWFSDALSAKCKLVYMPDTTKRRVDGRYAIDKEITSFADGYPTLLIGQSSLDDLNSRLPEKVSMERFRPNIVFTGAEPYEEDDLEAFTINNIQFFGVKLCGRCVMITINPNTAEKSKEPLRTLATYRRQNNKIYFGQNLLHHGEGLIHVGDTIEVIKRREKTRTFHSLQVE